MNILITGFKTKEEAQMWVNAYCGGVEQSMCVDAEKQGGGYSFPFAGRYHDIQHTEDAIILPLTHPDTYAK